jgi:hypothetical protein
MWRKMFEMYALGPIPPDDDIREAVLADRLRFEAKLNSTTADLPESRFTTITHESLIANPIEAIEQVYDHLVLGDFDTVRGTLIAETKRRREYQAKGSLPSDLWQQRINNEWAAIMTEHTTMRKRDWLGRLESSDPFVIGVRFCGKSEIALISHARILDDDVSRIGRILEIRAGVDRPSYPSREG